MRNAYWLVTFLLVLECVVLLIEPSECLLSFISVSVPTALQILTLLVKIKSIIFKILLGLKLMGVEGFIMKRRRRSITSEAEPDFVNSYDINSNSYLDWKLDSLPESQRTELLMLWRGLEKLLGRSIEFQEKVCNQAVRKYSRRPITIWDGAYLSKVRSRASRRQAKPNYLIKREPFPSKWSYSYWISTILGSALGSPYACHILEKQLNFNNFHYSSSDSMEDKSSSILTIHNSFPDETGAFS